MPREWPANAPQEIAVEQLQHAIGPGPTDLRRDVARRPSPEVLEYSHGTSRWRATCAPPFSPDPLQPQAITAEMSVSAATQPATKHAPLLCGSHQRRLT